MCGAKHGLGTIARASSSEERLSFALSTVPSYTGRASMEDWCVFCRIIARTEPAEVLFEDENVIVFRNRLRWVPVMLLVVPKEHLSQEEVWLNMDRVAEVAVQMGVRHCPNGFRVLSNFGHDAMQSQPHGHVHVIGGTFLGEYA